MRLGLAALAALTLLRLVIAAVTPLAPDEAYYWVWSRALAPGYLDHPPMVAIWIWLGTAIAGDGPLGIRLLGPLAVALGSVLLADAADRLWPGRHAGLAAASLLNATLLVGVGAIIMTPDAPLLFFWTCCLWAAARLITSGTGQWWLVIGLSAGLALASKYTAVFLWFGIAVWVLATPALRGWLLRPQPWLGALVGGAVFLPVVLWNASHGWASAARQGARIADWEPDRAIRFLGELIGGQIGLATPLVFLLCAVGIATAVRMAWRRRDPTWTLLAALTLPPVAVFVQHATGDRVQGNWPAIIYPAAAIAAVGLDGEVWRRLQRPAVLLGLVMTLLVYLLGALPPIPLPAGLVDPIALRLAGWQGLAAQIDAVRQQQAVQFVAADQYGIAAELARELPAGVPVVGVDARWALFDLPRAALTGQTGILVRTTRNGDDADTAPWSDIVEIGHAERRRDDGVTIESFRLFRVIGRESPVPTVLLPRPR